MYIYNYAGLSKNAGYPEPAILMRTWWSVMEFGGSFAAKILSPSPMTNSPGVSGIARMITWLLDLGNILCIFCVYLYIYRHYDHCCCCYSYCHYISLLLRILLSVVLFNYIYRIDIYMYSVHMHILYIYVQIYIYILLDRIPTAGAGPNLSKR